MRAVINSTGSYLPPKIWDNDHLSTFIDTSDEWIFPRTGIKQRHIAEDDVFTSDLAAKAAENALKNSDLDAHDIDLIIVATTTPDRIFPSVAVKVQDLIGAKCPAFDVQAVCSGFVYGISLVQNLIENGAYKNIMLIGAETMSKIVDWKDRRSCVLFGDGAGAVIFSTSDEDAGVIATEIHSDGAYIDILKADEYVLMDGQEVFKHAVSKLVDVSKSVLKKSGISEIDWLVPHQANQRIISYVGKKLKLKDEKVISTVKHHANCSAASIALALDESKDKFKKGDIILLPAIGGGLTWGASLVKW